MNLSEIFVKRPVMTTLVMLALLIFGVLGYRLMPVDALPNVDFPTISVTAALPGASPETMAATVATPLERQFATISGIDSMNSTSALGTTSITIQFDLNRNIDSAAQDVQSAIAAALPILPPLPARPAFRKVNSGDMPVLFIAISSDTLPLYKVDEYAETDAAQRISMVDGVAQVQVFGSQKYAVRVSIDPRKIAQMGIGINQIAQAMQKGNVKMPTGTLYGAHTVTNVQSNDQLKDAAAWRQLIVAYNQNSPVRLEQVATVTDSVENDKIANWCDGKRAVVLAILRQPGTNTIKVIDEVKKLLPSLRAQFPASVNLSILYDRSTSIKTSINDVQITLLITAVLVVAVIFLFLRNARATIIPSLALPMSIIGTFAVISLLGFSINVMTLMALTLCTGFVVDDAIVVLENIVRHLDADQPPFKAALDGSREISFTILSMTLSLVAVFIPVLFFGGVVGRLFKEFAVTIVVSVVISGFVSLSLTPMLCSRFLVKHDAENEGGFLRFFESVQRWMLSCYDYWLKVVIKHKLITLISSFVIVGITFFLFGIVQKGFIPNEDIGQIFGMSEGAQDVSYEEMVRHQQQVAEIVSRDPNVLTFMSAVGAGGPSATMNSGRVFMMLKPRDQRQLSADQIIQEMKKKLAPIPGIRIFMQNPMAMKLGGQNTKGIYQLTMQGTNLPQLYSGTFALMDKLKTNDKLQDVNTDLLLNSPQAKVTINKEKAYSLGITTKQIDDALSLAYGGTQISTIYTPTNEYKVIIEVAPQYYRSPNLLSLLYLRSSSGKLIPLDSIAEIGRSVSALQVNHLGQLASSTISFNLKPDISLGSVLPDIQKQADEILPPSVTSSFQGTAQAFQSSQQNSLALLVLAIAVIYIVLGILYESFIHPLTILAGLPSAGFGALVTLLIFHAELNIYAWLGLVMLLGIVKKNAIMMVDSALDLQRLQNQKPEEAIYNAALIRFRPIMMTTMAALMGSLPIALGFGAGGDARQPLGLAVVGGLIASQVLTLLITPVVYIYLDKFTGAGRRRKLKLQYEGASS